VRSSLRCPGVLALAAVFRAIASHELVEIGAREAVLLQREVLVGAQIVEPNRLGPRRLTRWLSLEEQDVGLDALSVKDTGREPQDGVQIALVHQLAAHGFA